MVTLYFLGAKNKRFYARFLARFILSFFQFFLLNLILLIALSNVMEQFINDTLHIFGFELMSIQLFSISELPQALALFSFFLISDFIQWNVHLLHTIPFLWKIHKTHHSVKEMGFAAHFRYNWMEPLVYKSILYIPIILIGGVNLQMYLLCISSRLLLVT
jgi:sterol desaturase/sphingolipid hydroxylase (fatty acid hydroxylase superfamily)